MPPVSQDVLFNRAIDLVSKQDDTVQAWAGRLVALESGFAIAIGAVLSWRGWPPGWPVTIAVVTLATIAGLLGVLMASVVERHLAWQRAYIDSVKLIEGSPTVLYRDKMVDPVGMRIAPFFTTVKWVFLAGWLILIVILLVVQCTAGVQVGPS